MLAFSLPVFVIAISACEGIENHYRMAGKFDGEFNLTVLISVNINFPDTCVFPRGTEILAEIKVALS